MYPLKKISAEYDSLLYHWDTIYCNGTSNQLIFRIVEDLNGFGSVSSRTTDKFQNNTWVSYKRENYTYEASGRLLQILSEKWADNMWKPDAKNIWTYNANGDQTSYLSYFSDGNNWTNFASYTYYYSVPVYYDSVIQLQGSGSQWNKFFRYTCTWDSAGNNTLNVIEKWFDTQYELYSRETMTYNAAGSETEILKENWSGTGWTNNIKTTLVYDSIENLLSTTQQLWNSLWINFFKTENTYDSLSRLLTHSTMQWSGGTWENQTRELFVYDPSGNILDYEQQQFTTGWTNYLRTVYEYDDYGNSQSGTNFRYNSNGWVKDLRTTTVYSNFTHDFTIYDPIFYFSAHISSFPVGTSEREEVSFQIYPNPSKTFFRVNLPDGLNNPSMKIFDMKGNLIRESILRNKDNIIPANNFAPGNYVIWLTDCKFSGNYMLVIIR